MDRFTWGVVAAIAALVVAGLAAAVLLQRPGPPADLARPEGVVRAYEEAIGGGRPDQAWDLLAAPARADVTREEFLRRATLLARRPPGRVAIGNVAVEGDVARVHLDQTYAGGTLFGPSPPVVRTTVRLVREDGQWRIEVPSEPYLISREARMAP
jgi:hypothetical protein